MAKGKLPLAQRQTKSPLHGKRVLVTRSDDKANSLSQLLREEGYIVVEVPAIEIAPLDDFKALDSRLMRLGQYHWVVFGSARGVEAVMERIKVLGLDASVFGHVKVAAVGPSVAKALQQAGVAVDLMPATYHSWALVDAFASLALRGRKVLVPSADIGGRTLGDGLTSLGAIVDRVAAYKTIAPQGSREKIEEAFARGIDIVTFTSSSSVRNLLSLLDGRLEILSSAKVACIGPVTSNTALELGLRVDVTAKEHTLSGLVNSIKEYYGKECS